MSFPRYPKYKPSGVEWLGELPEHWVVSRLGFEAWVRARLGWKGLKAEEYVEDGYVLLSTPNIKDAFIDFENVNFISRERFEESPEIVVREGDVLLAKDGSTLGTVNVVRKLPRAATVNSSVAVITPRDRLNSHFLYRLFGGAYLENTIQQVKGGMGVPHLFQADLNKFYLPLPPRDEQAAIAAFLDRETAKIDALVAEQRRLMELLKEKRQAVISDAVTKGLNPNAPMKPSGIEWLGDVPAHWQVTRLEHVCEFVWGKAHEAFVEDDGAHLCVTARFVSTGGDSRRMCTENFTPAKQGDILMVMSDLPNGRALARAYLIRDQRSYAVNQRVCGIRVRDGDSRYFAYQLDRNPELLSQDDGSNQTHLSNHDFTKLRVVAPPRAEQSEIAEEIDAKLAAFDALSNNAARAIDLLQERRTALISAAVTGQIDVRGLTDTEAT